MPTNGPTLSSAISFTIAELNRHAGELATLAQPLRVIVIVHAAQGVIDNGGLQYFFEADFQGSPPYDTIVDAYRAIGADAAARALADAVALFPFAEPHKHVDKRNAFMDSFKDEDGDPINSPFERLTGELCGNEDVWRKLEVHVARHAAIFLDRA